MSEQHRQSEEVAREKRREEIAPILKEAIKLGHWIHVPYQDLWLHPEDMAKANEEGRFLFDAKTLRVKPSTEYLEKLDADILKLTTLRAKVFGRSNGGES